MVKYFSYLTVDWYSFNTINGTPMVHIFIYIFLKDEGFTITFRNSKVESITCCFVKIINIYIEQERETHSMLNQC